MSEAKEVKEVKEEKEEVKGLKPKSIDDLKKLSVKELRKYISSNKIFKGGLSSLSKKQLITDITASDFWKKRKGIKKPTKVVVEKELTTTLNTKRKLQKKLQECERRLKQRDTTIAKLETVEEEEKEEDKPKQKTKRKPKKKPEKEVKEEKKDILEQVESALENIVLIPKSDEDVIIEEAKDEAEKIIVSLRPDNVKVENLENLVEKITEDIKEVVEDRKEDIIKKVKTVIKEAPQPQPQPIPRDLPHPASIVPQQTIPQNTDGLITYQDPQRRIVDTGHTIVNMYCGGSHHPDFPVPQSVVRQALNSQTAPYQDYHRTVRNLRDIEPSIPRFEGIPKEVIPEPVQHKSQSASSIRSRFETAPKPSRKFPEVKSADVLRKTRTIEPEQEEKADPFGEPEEENIPETDAEKRVRLQKEELAKLASFRKKKAGATDRVRAQLEGIFAKRATPPSETASEPPFSSEEGKQGDIPTAPPL